MTLIWILVFFISLFVMVKGADWFLGSAEKIGLALKLPLFVVGVVITGIGTSLPETISSLFAVSQGATEIVAANAIGSNVANILLVIGIAALVGRQLSIHKNLIDLEIPLLASSTAIFLSLAYDGVITRMESVILVIGFILYMGYILTHHDDIKKRDSKKAEKKAANEAGLQKSNGGYSIAGRDIVLLIIGLAGLIFGSQYLIKSVVSLSEIWDIATGVIAISAIAVGTSLPELLVSVKAAMRGKSDVALGNIFGSNAFNLLMVVGVPGLFSELRVDDVTLSVGLPFLFGATFLFIISGISKRIHNWEGVFYLLFYVIFSAKLFGLF